MRTKDAKTKKLCWNVTIKQSGVILHNQDYTTLKKAADDLGLTYSQICELGPNGRCKKKSINFKFMPDIKIKKIAELPQDTIINNNIETTDSEIDFD
jgi:hypothetical protein